jgi:hypothetical protein
MQPTIHCWLLLNVMFGPRCRYHNVVVGAIGIMSVIMIIVTKELLIYSMSQLWGISEIFLEATKNTNSTYRLILCLI